MPELWQRNLSGHLNSHPGIGAQRRLPVIGTCRNFKGTFNSLVAGFLETGETLESVWQGSKEETGLDVKNIRYFGSQPWPYPSGLMVGFIADYTGGDIHLQDDELSSGNFYTRDHLPELPRKLSLARKMIDWWIAQQ